MRLWFSELGHDKQTVMPGPLTKVRPAFAYVSRRRYRLTWIYESVRAGRNKRPGTDDTTKPGGYGGPAPSGRYQEEAEAGAGQQQGPYTVGGVTYGQPHKEKPQSMAVGRKKSTRRRRRKRRKPRC